MMTKSNSLPENQFFDLLQKQFKIKQEIDNLTETIKEFTDKKVILENELALLNTQLKEYGSAMTMLKDLLANSPVADNIESTIIEEKVPLINKETIKDLTPHSMESKESNSEIFSDIDDDRNLSVFKMPDTNPSDQRSVHAIIDLPSMINGYAYEARNRAQRSRIPFSDIGTLYFHPQIAQLFLDIYVLRYGAAVKSIMIFTTPKYAGINTYLERLATQPKYKMINIKMRFEEKSSDDYDNHASLWKDVDEIVDEYLQELIDKPTFDSTEVSRIVFFGADHRYTDLFDELIQTKRIPIYTIFNKFASPRQYRELFQKYSESALSEGEYYFNYRYYTVEQLQKEFIKRYPESDLPMLHASDVFMNNVYDAIDTNDESYGVVDLSLMMKATKADCFLAIEKLVANKKAIQMIDADKIAYRLRN